MRLYNTATRSVEPFKPQSQSVTLYTCGPTVYDYPHIGNWYTFIRYDLLNRVLIASGYKTTWVMNITDVGHLVSDGDEGEDKLEKGAKREGKTAWEIAEYYTNYFTAALQSLTFSRISQLTKATDFIQQQIALIQRLEKRGYTYKIDDGIYFDTSKFSDYGNFAGLDLAHQEAGTRVEVSTQKRQPSDFALWKFSAKGVRRDMEWDSPWGKGFPGWHLECSAMIEAVLGQPIDIHGGGIDHIPIHHTNEIAQSVCAYDKPLSKYWFHCNHILVDGQKMSKSLGNVYTLEDVQSKGYDLETFRFHVLSGHYRSHSEFSWETLEASLQRLKRLWAFADLRWQYSEDAPVQDFEEVKNRILSALQDDLNSPLAISHLDEHVTAALDNKLNAGQVKPFSDLIEWIDEIFGLRLHTRPSLKDKLQRLIDDREVARREKNWQRADEIRAILESSGVTIRDTAAGTLWTLQT